MYCAVCISGSRYVEDPHYQEAGYRDRESRKEQTNKKCYVFIAVFAFILLIAAAVAVGVYFGGGSRHKVTLHFCEFTSHYCEVGPNLPFYVLTHLVSHTRLHVVPYMVYQRSLKFSFCSPLK